MIIKNIYSGNSWLSFRTALFADSASSKSSLKHLFENALGTTRQYLRGLFRNHSNLHSEIIRKQHRLPAKYFKDSSKPTFASKFNFVSYQLGSIQKATSRWCYKSLTNTLRADLLRKFYRGGSGPIICFVGFALAKKPSLLTEEEEYEGVSYLIRDSFSSVSWKGAGLNIDKDGILSSVSLADLKIGELIAKGCNAAIYSACLNDYDSKNGRENFISSQVEEDAGLPQTDQNSTDLHDSELSISFLEGKQDSRILGEQFLSEKGSDSISVEENNKNASVLYDSQFLLPSLEGKQNSRILGEKSMLEERKDNNKVKDKNVDGFYNSQFLLSCLGEEQNLSNSTAYEKGMNFPPGSLAPFNIAVKVMFNYSAESNAFAIWNAMYKETLPISGEFSLGNVWNNKKRKKLKPHPNIVEMYSAFADQLPLLPGAINNYPQALPTRLQEDGCGRNMTLFLVMKRYHCCLKDYLQAQNVASETSLLLFAQLLEALVHLFQNNIAHRDLKSDNILLDLSQGMSSPRLVITDFGCCLESLSLPYTSYDINKGGNLTLMAPEVINSEPGQFSVIDYSRADSWSAGTIAYEIFGESNPFYAVTKLKSNTYEEKDLPPFPKTAPPAVQKLVLEMLHINPKQRPSQNLAATICQVLLQAPPDLLSQSLDSTIHKKALEWMFQLSAQTYLETSITHPENISVKLELCRTFSSRIQYLEIVQALEYISE